MLRFRRRCVSEQVCVCMCISKCHKKTWHKKKGEPNTSLIKRNQKKTTIYPEASKQPAVPISLTYLLTDNITNQSQLKTVFLHSLKVECSDQAALAVMPVRSNALHCGSCLRHEILLLFLPWCFIVVDTRIKSTFYGIHRSLSGIQASSC